MNTFITRIIHSLPLCLLIWTTQTASAWYDPGLQRWINRDSIADSGFAPNLQRRTPDAGVRPAAALPSSGGYVFVSNAPLTKRDPLGLSEEDVFKLEQLFKETMDAYCKQGIRWNAPGLGN